MRKTFTALSLLSLLSLLVSSCASDGGFAGREKPLDKQATLDAACQGLRYADTAFQALVAAKPDLVDEQGMRIQRAVMQGAEQVCQAEYTGDRDLAVNVAIAALVQVSSLLADAKANAQ